MGTITVCREMDNGTGLVELFCLELGVDGTFDGVVEDNPAVFVYVCEHEALTPAGVPPEDVGVRSETRFSDVPSAVQQEFVNLFVEFDQHRETMVSISNPDVSVGGN